MVLHEFYFIDGFSLFNGFRFRFRCRRDAAGSQLYAGNALSCSAGDPNFSNYDYPEKIARCDRNVSTTEKAQVAHDYGVPKSEWSNYEFDHLIPLCAAGGSDDPKNILAPAASRSARKKDKVESRVCRGMAAGTMTQAEAVQAIHDWFNQ